MKGSTASDLLTPAAAGCGFNERFEIHNLATAMDSATASTTAIAHKGTGFRDVSVAGMGGRSLPRPEQFEAQEMTAA